VHLQKLCIIKIFALCFIYVIETAPKVIKLFANRTNLGFSDANDVEPTQILDLTQEDLQGHKDIELRFVKFQRVKSITVRIFKMTFVMMYHSLLGESLAFCRRKLWRRRNTHRQSSFLWGTSCWYKYE
jgi:hypothetical protein